MKTYSNLNDIDDVDSLLKRVEKKLKSVKDVSTLGNEFPDIDQTKLDQLSDIIDGKFLGMDICHGWYDSETQETQIYYGRTIKLKGKGLKYEVTYWLPSETFEDGEDFEMSKFSLGADLVMDDLAVL